MNDPVQAILAGLDDEIRSKPGIETVIPSFLESAGGNVQTAITAISELNASGDLDRWLPRSLQDLEVNEVLNALDREVEKKPGIKSLIRHVLANRRDVAEAKSVMKELCRDEDFDEMIASAVEKERFEEPTG